ncbi:LON peptidase substrate-binding domain-containing protein [Shewanella sp. NIFS-20-20]|uniref:LON peptidase substrate-binding domain-containing protein n=1 Tax=Shewanella sp. NIFS-20-20 TaxID=2853806 RepID=UPI001C491245|nr:LON peptidase substrate-binding domain-containing protein [Shewanella sp. NIFS-20-20]MBV7314323.1 LON peptidase substrate-binding domain-containing protein [Shewanella sp. NIFS-20-20]
MQLPLFVLNQCLLPGGYLQLRIFEPRYQRLVSIATSNQQGFGVCLPTPSGPAAIGTLAEIIDFETLEDGLLGITIFGKQRFNLKQTTRESDGLQLGTVALLPQWPSLPVKPSERILQTYFSQILQQYPLQHQAYEEAQLDDIGFLCQRWLEMLPIENDKKLQCIHQSDHRLTMKLLHSIFKITP